MSPIVDRRNLDFLLYEVLPFAALLKHPRFGDYDRAAINDVLDLTQSIAEHEFLPFAAELDANEPKFVDGRVEILPQVGAALRACAEAGLFAAGFDHADGGLQMPMTVTAIINGILSCANLGVANYQFLTVGAARMLSTFGDAEQKALYLPPMLAGTWFGTMCLSEPQAGSSLADIRTTATPVEGRLHHIKGAKMWISGGDHELTENIVHMVLARRPDGPPGVKGISLFIVPKHRPNPDGSPGAANHIALAGLNHKMGQRGTTNCLLNFGEDGETHGWLVGEPHQGLAYMFHMMNEARISVGTGSAMSGLAGFLHSLDYAQTRPQGRRLGNKDPRSPQVPIIAHADVRRMLLDQKASVEGAIALSCFCSLLVDQAKVAATPAEHQELELLLDLLTPIAKSWPSEHCLEANKWAIQILGGYGYTRDYPVERFYRDNRLNHIHEGAYGIQGLDLLGRKVPAHGGRGLELLLGRIRETIAAAPADFAADVRRLEEALTALLDATRAVAACDNAERAMANATLYLDAMGTIVVAWLWLRQASVAAEALAGQPADPLFYQGKIAAFRYFSRYRLPAVLNALAVVEALDDTCLALDPDMLRGS